MQRVSRPNPGGALYFAATPLGDTFRRLLRALRGSGVPHVFVGMAAQRAYGFMPARPGGVEVLEVVLLGDDLERFRAEVLLGEFRLLPGQRTRLHDPQTQVEVDLIDAACPVNDPLLAAAGLRMPDPRMAVELEQTPVPSAELMVEWLLGRNAPGDREWAAELVQRFGADGAFAKRLHPAVRGMCADLIS